eukprot:590857-Rhodomonas_salina.2
MSSAVERTRSAGPACLPVGPECASDSDTASARGHGPGSEQFKLPVRTAFTCARRILQERASAHKLLVVGEVETSGYVHGFVAFVCT